VTLDHQQLVHRNRARPRPSRALAAVVAALTAFAGLTAAAAAGPGSQIVVPGGRPVQIAVALDRSTSIGQIYTPSIRNAIRLALQLRPSIHGFRVQLNDAYDAPCGGAADVVAQNAAAATQVVGNPQTVAVIGHMCSYPFGAAADPCPSPTTTGTALSIYESAGIATINGSTTSPCLPTDGPTVFNATAVPGPAFTAWYAEVQSLPLDRLWRLLYQFEFGAPPGDFADLYFDATNLLLARLTNVSAVLHGNLVINRANLAAALRRTTDFPGVTCAVSLDPATGYRTDDPAELAQCAG
jgi:hypothetical protein